MINAVIFGRFQPFHSSHYKILETALNACDKVYIGICSANISGTLKNPMSVFDRKAYIKNYIIHNIEKPYLLDRIGFIFVDDYLYDYNFLREINRIIKDKNISYFFGHKKPDGSSDWVNDLYTTYDELPVFVDVETGEDISSTKIRQRVLEGYDVGNYDWSPYREYSRKIKEYNDKFVHPYSNISTHLTADLIIEDFYRKKILLIKRNKGFGSGRYAMIGGFVEPNETCFEAIKRELFEEIGFDIDNFTVDDFDIPLFVDNPTRSDRGRIVTYVFKLSVDNLNVDNINNNFVPNDEVSEIVWVDKELFNSVIKYQMLEDHATIIYQLEDF